MENIWNVRDSKETNLTKKMKNLFKIITDIFIFSYFNTFTLKHNGKKGR